MTSSSLSSSEVKTLLKSLPNVLAQKAVELIRANGEPSALRALMEAGAAGQSVKRDPLHPRTRLLRENLLSVCYDDPTKPLVPATRTLPGGVKVQTFTISIGAEFADRANWQRRLELFKVLLAFPSCVSNHNGGRGDLFDHILNQVFAYDAGEMQLPFAQALIATGRVNLLAWADRSYAWMGSVENLERLKSLGVPLATAGLFDHMMKLFGCAPNSGRSNATKAASVTVMLDAGCRLAAGNAALIRWSGDSSCCHARKHLKQCGLFERVCQAIDGRLTEIEGNANVKRTAEVLTDASMASLALQLDTAVALRDDILRQIHDCSPNDTERDALWARYRPLDEAVKSCDGDKLSAAIEAVTLQAV